MRRSPETPRTYRGIDTRFATWLAEREQVEAVSIGACSSEALVAYLHQLEARCCPATVKKERAALRKLARYLHQLGLLDVTVILMIEIPTETASTLARQGLDQDSWERVLMIARARLAGSARTLLAGCGVQGSCSGPGARWCGPALARGPSATA
jgi:hypothetical protein